jgi:hypothetical protein
LGRLPDGICRGQPVNRQSVHGGIEGSGIGSGGLSGDPVVFPKSASIIGKPSIRLSATSSMASFDRYHTFWISTLFLVCFLFFFSSLQNFFFSLLLAFLFSLQNFFFSLLLAFLFSLQIFFFSLLLAFLFFLTKFSLFSFFPVFSLKLKKSL